MRRMIKSHLRWCDTHIAQIEKLMEETISDVIQPRETRQC
jgi:hypothetical protein